MKATLCVLLFSWAAYAEMPTPLPTVTATVAPTPVATVAPPAPPAAPVPTVKIKPNGFTASCSAKGSAPRGPGETVARDRCIEQLDAGCAPNQLEYACAEQSSGAGNPDGAYTFTCNGATLGPPAAGFIEFRTDADYIALCSRTCTCTFAVQ